MARKTHARQFHPAAVLHHALGPLGTCPLGAREPVGAIRFRVHQGVLHDTPAIPQCVANVIVSGLAASAVFVIAKALGA